MSASKIQTFRDTNFLFIKILNEGLKAKYYITPLNILENIVIFYITNPK